MRHSVLPLFLTGMILLLILAVPVNAATISDISPDAGNTGDSVTVTITGTNFTSTEGDVWLEMSGEDDIDASIRDWENDEIECRFIIDDDIATGDWDVVIRIGSQQIREDNAFTITESMTLTSISPTSAQVDDDDVDFTLLGTGLSDVSDVYLYNNDYDKIYAIDVVKMSKTKVEGTFDLTDADEDTYDVCVVDSLDTEECDLSFKISSDAYGSIDISSSPSGASIYMDGSYIGTTPDTAEDLEEGSYKVVLKKSGYNDWGKVVKVTEGETTEIDADLDVITPAPTAAVWTTVPTTVKTTVKSTLQVPTSWPSAAAPTTQASPLDSLIVIGAAGIGIGLVALRCR